jgi:hypothetical protein
VDVSRLRQASAEELLLVETGLADFSQAFNSVPHVQPHPFIGTPADFSRLDWVFYELGGSLWYSDHGFGFTCVWGNVLVRSFGFHWSVMAPPRDLRDYVLHHPDAYQVFPWQRLWETVENPGPQFAKGEAAWLRIVADVDLFGCAPRGWHPALDAIRGDRRDFPSKVTQMLRTFLERCPFSCFEQLTLWPYNWNADTQWDQVQIWLEHLLWKAGNDS